MQSREYQTCGMRSGLIGRTLMLSDDGMAASSFLEIFMTRKVPGSLSEVPCHSAKPTKMVAEQENNRRKNCEKRFSFIKLLKDTFK